MRVNGVGESGSYRSPRHGMPLNSTTRGSKTPVDGIDDVAGNSRRP